MRQLTNKDLGPATVRGSNYIHMMVSGVFMILGAVHLLDAWGLDADSAAALQAGIGLVIGTALQIAAKIASGKTLAVLEQREARAYSQGLREEVPSDERGLAE